MPRSCLTFPVVLTVVVSSVAMPATPEAQPAGLTPGAYVRINAPAYNLRDRTGTLVHAMPDSLTIKVNGRQPVTLPMAGLSRIEISRGKNLGQGLRRGAAIGFVAGAVLGLLAAATQPADDDDTLPYPVVGGGGALAGTLVGALVGLAAAPRRWEDVALARQPRDAGTARHRAAPIIAVTLSF